MDRVYQSNAIETPPSAVASSGSYPTSGNKASGQLATVPGPYWFYSVTEEIRNAIIEAGLNPNSAQVNQLATAFSKYLPINGGNVTGDLTIKGSYLARSVNGIAADNLGNVALGNLVKKVNGIAAGSDGNVTLPSEGVPVGTVIAMAANSAPDGYLLCNGSAVSRTTYAALFDKIGTTYGSSNSSTFNLPNLTDRFIQGSATAGTVKNAGLPNITGTFARSGDGWHDGSIATGAFTIGDANLENCVNSGSDNAGLVNFDASRSNKIYGNSTTVQPPALTMRYYIKY